MKFLSVASGIIAAVLMLSCDDSDSTLKPANTFVVSASRISGCGGFLEQKKTSTDNYPFSYDPATYDDAERIQWCYDAENSVLDILNARVRLNCCGERSITALQENGAIVLRENDQPEEGGGRCRCICSYDFHVELSGIPNGKIELKLDLTVDDDTIRKWEGSIDLGAGRGEVIVDDKPV